MAVTPEAVAMPSSTCGKDVWWQSLRDLGLLRSLQGEGSISMLGSSGEDKEEGKANEDVLVKYNGELNIIKSNLPILAANDCHVQREHGGANNTKASCDSVNFCRIDLSSATEPANPLINISAICKGNISVGFNIRM